MRSLLAVLLLAATSPAAGETLRDLCPDRPGNATPPCIVDAGHVQVETAITGWTHDRRDGVTTDSFALAETEVRVGLTPRLEIELQWQPYGTFTRRDRTSGFRDHAEGTGDVTLGLRRSLARPDGAGFSVAVQPFVTAPAGHSSIGNGGWSGGVLLPVSYDLGSDWTLAGTPEIDWTPDTTGDGHHFAYTAVAALSRKLGALAVGVELWANRDADPDAPVTEATADVTLAWTVASDLQLDVGANAGLTRDTPRIALYIGIARRF